MAVAHAKARVAMRRAVVARTAEPFDQEQGEALAHDRRDLLPALVATMDGHEVGLVLVHVIVETLREARRRLDAHRIEGRVVGTELPRVFLVGHR